MTHPATSVSLGNSSEMQIHPRPTESETPEAEPEFPEDFQVILIDGEHCKLLILMNFNFPVSSKNSKPCHQYHHPQVVYIKSLPCDPTLYKALYVE